MQSPQLDWLRVARLRLQSLEDRITPDANPAFGFLPPATGGAMIAAGDVTGDGFADVITGPAVLGPPVVQVFDGRTGGVVWQFAAYAPTFSGGVSVAVGDITGDGRLDIVTGAEYGGGPNVKVFDGVSRQEVRSFFAFIPTFTGGARVAAGDVTGDGRADIAVAAGFGGSPVVAVFDGVTGVQVTVVAVGDPSHAVGATVALADLTGDGKAELIVGSGGGTPTVQVFDLTAGPQPLVSFSPYSSAFSGPVWVAVGEATGDQTPDIVTVAGVTGAPNVRLFDGRSQALLRSWMAYDSAFQGGAFVATADVNGDGRADIVTGAGPCGGPNVRAFAASDAQLLTSFSANGTSAPAFASDATPPVVTVFTRPGTPGRTPPRIDGRVTDIGSGVDRLEVSVNGGTVSSVELLPNGTFAFTPTGAVEGANAVVFQAFDRAGNRSVPVRFRFALDSVSPGVTVNPPPQFVNAIPTLTGAVSDPAPSSGVVSVRASVNGGGFAEVPFQPSGAFAFTPSGLADGAHAITFRGLDLAGNPSDDVTVSFTLDTVQPVVTITTPPPATPVNVVPTVAGQVTDVGSGVAALQASVNGGGFVAVAFQPDGSFAFTPTGTVQGVNTVVIRAFDRAGNQSSLATFVFNLDTIRPVVTLTTPLPSGPYSSEPTLNGIATDTGGSGVASVQAAVDGLAFTNVPFLASGSFSFTPTALADGSHVVAFRAFDVAGNVSVTVTFAFDILTPIP